MYIIAPAARLVNLFLSKYDRKYNEPYEAHNADADDVIENFRTSVWVL